MQPKNIHLYIGQHLICTNQHKIHMHRKIMRVYKQVIERERERERDISIHGHTDIHNLTLSHGHEEGKEREKQVPYEKHTTWGNKAPRFCWRLSSRVNQGQ